MHSSNQSSPISLGAGELALGRHLTYEFLGRLYLEGVTAVTLPTLQSISELAGSLPHAFDADEAAADYQTLFGFNVFPYESIFLDASGLLGGATSDAVLHSYQEAGFQIHTGSTSPDHIGHELQMLAHLCGAEADALEDNLPLVAGRMRNLQHEFMQNHLSQWLVPFVLAVKAQKRPFYTALADLTLAFVHDHLQEIESGGKTGFLPTPPSLLDNEKTGLKEIAQYLATPPYSGFFISRDDVARLARTQNIPRGFGDRTQMLANLLRGAAQFEALPALLDELQAFIHFWENEYTNIANSFPRLTPFIAGWQNRTAVTGQILTQIEQQIEIA